MLIYCPRRLLFIFSAVVFFYLFLVKPSPIEAAPCGNGLCQETQGETCSTCPQDCGACPTTTPTPTPVPTPPEATSTPTITPTTTPATSTPSSGDSPSASSSPGPVIYPSLTINRQGLLFSGTASISQGVIDAVEYSLDDGGSWQKATPKDGRFDEISEEYTFSSQSRFNVGVHKIIARSKSLADVYTQGPNYAVITITVSVPKVTLDKILPNPTKNQTPSITGTASSNFAAISAVQISLDEGKTWFPAKLTGKIFSLTTNQLEDGNYPVRARAFDIAGNVGESETQIIIIDKIPPIIGGNITALGPQILTPDRFGIVRSVAGAENKIVVSMRGGVITASLDIQDTAFKLTPIEGTNLWTGKIVFKETGKKTVKIAAVDGAGNITEKQLNTFLVEESGKVITGKNNSPVKNAKVSLFLFESIGKSWTEWNGASFGQQNPQNTKDDGSYNFIAPPGRYYLEVSAPGYRKMQSEIFELDKTTTLVAVFPLTPRPRIFFRLPVLGEVNFVIPVPFLSQTLDKSNALWQESDNQSPEFKPQRSLRAPDFSLPGTEGKTINLVDFKGKSLVLTFLSIWTPPSVEQALILNQTNQLLNNNQSMLTIFLQDTPGEVETFMKRGGYTFEALTDKDGATGENYQVSTLPQHVFINSKGFVNNTFVGVLGQKDLLEKLELLD